MTKFTTTRKTRSGIIAVLVSALLLVSCSSSPSKGEKTSGESKKTENRGSIFAGKKPRPASRAGLELPPDLLSSANDKVQSNSLTKGGISTAAVLPEIVGATIQSDSGRRWLEVDADAEVVWRKLTEFWAFEGIELVLYEPGSGLMETDWFVKREASAGSGVRAIAGDILGALTSWNTAHDKMTLRLERNGTGSTNIYVTHRIREKVSENPNSKQNTVLEWVEQPEDPEKVAQMLQTLILLFDSTSETADVEDTADDAATEAAEDAAEEAPEQSANDAGEPA